MCTGANCTRQSAGGNLTECAREDPLGVLEGSDVEAELECIVPVRAEWVPSTRLRTVRCDPLTELKQNLKVRYGKNGL